MAAAAAAAVADTDADAEDVATVEEAEAGAILAPTPHPFVTAGGRLSPPCFWM